MSEMPLPFTSSKAIAQLGLDASGLNSHWDQRTPPDRVPRSPSLRSEASASSQKTSLLNLVRSKVSAKATQPQRDARTSLSDRKSSSDSLVAHQLASSASSLASSPLSEDPERSNLSFDESVSLQASKRSSQYPAHQHRKSYSIKNSSDTATADDYRFATPTNRSAELPYPRSQRALPAEGQSAVEDATEEIVPWMFDHTDSSGPAEGPFMRQRTRHVSAMSTSSPGFQYGALKPSRSFGNLRGFPDIQSDSPPQSKPPSGFLNKIKKKFSKADLAKLDMSGSPTFASDNPFDSIPPRSPSTGSFSGNARMQFASSKLRKHIQKGQKKTNRDDSNNAAEAHALAAASTGITLDTNLDQMEGIVNASALGSTNGFTGYLNEDAPQRPSTPDSFIANSLMQRRGPSAVPSQTTYDSTGPYNSPGISPTSSLKSFRQPSVTPNRTWSSSFGVKSRSSSSHAIGISVARPNGTYVPLDEETIDLPFQNCKTPGGTKSTQVAQGAGAVNSLQAGWTAPESWAVEEVMLNSSDADRSDDDASFPGSHLVGALGSSSPSSYALEEKRQGQGFAQREGRPIPRRPFTAFDHLDEESFALRVTKPDGSHTTIVTHFAQTVADIQCIVARKPGFVTGKGIHKLFVQDRGLERPMALHERPIRLQQLRLEQAGYTEWDRPGALGRQDHSYLIKFIFKPDAAPRIGSDDFNVDTYEYVDLRGRSLMTIPILLYNHAHDIVSLNLSRNHKLDLPADFIQLCTSLRELRLSDTYTKRVPQSVRQAAGLTRLDISCNRLQELDHIMLNELKELILLEAYNNRLSTLPGYFGHFPFLKYLNISNNKFAVFPQIVCDIGSLVDLDLSFNALANIAPEISKLKNLERFHMVGNAVQELPLSFQELTKLQDFDCRQNCIESLAVISNVPSLLTFRGDYNRCSVLDLNSRSLRSFSISHNPLTRFSVMGTGATLTHLDISHGKLLELDPECFRHLGSLETLIFDANQIRLLPEDLSSLGSLLRLSGKHNKLESLPNAIGSLSRLQYLNVSNNNISVIPAAIWFAPELIYLNASSNLLDDFPDPPTENPNEQHEALDLMERKMSIVSRISVSRGSTPLAAALQELYLADNRLVDDIFHPVSLMSDLRILNLSFNEIVEIPHRVLSKSVQLEELYLSGNKLQTLPEDDFERLVNLKTIHLNANKLTTLPAELGTLKKLEVLDVGCNMLKYNIANWKYDWNWNWNLELRYLNLSGNKRLEIKPAVTQTDHAYDGSHAAAKRRNLSDFGSLRKIRTLGLMDVTLMIPSVPDDTDERRVRTSGSEINELGYGIADTLGATDNLSIIDLMVPKFRTKDDECIFGIFDGQMQPTHGGARLAKYLQDSFGPTFTGELNKLVDGESDVVDVLRRTFLSLNRDYGNIVAPAYVAQRRSVHRLEEHPKSSADARSGASGVVAYIAQKTLYIANVGRCLAVIAGRNGQARALTTKHAPLAPQEWAKIRANEGWISNKGFVNDEVDVSKSFGHYHVFPAINAAPDIQVYDLTEGDELVVLGNRGLWDYVDYQSAVDIARSERGDPMMAAQKLRDLAIAYGSTRHTMVMVVTLTELFKTRLGYRRKAGSQADGEVDNYVNKAIRAKPLSSVAPTERYLSLMDREIPAPTGEVALVFTDIRNSTSLWDSNPGMHVAMRMHNQLLRRQLRAIGGYEVKTEGDAFMCSFPSVIAAVLWAFTVQLELLREDWPVSILDCEDGMEIIDPEAQEVIYRGLSVRMGIHCGHPHCETDPITRRMDYFGPVVNRAARVTALAEGGQITASFDVVDLIKRLCEDNPDGTRIEESEDFAQLNEGTRRDITAIRNMGVVMSDLGERRLKGLETTEFVSLLYPKALAGRLRYSTVGQGRPSTSDNTTQLIEPVPRLFDVELIQAYGIVCLRLEAAIAAQRPGSAYARAYASSPVLPPGTSTAGRRRKPSVHPYMASYPIRIDATDDDLYAILEGLTTRIENVVNSMVIAQLGPYTEVLSALSQATRIDPGAIVRALSMFSGSMGAAESSQSVTNL